MYSDLIVNHSLLLNENGEWPNFHDAEVLSVNCCGLVSEDDGEGHAHLFIGPSITVSLELCGEDKPYIITLRFSGCSNVKMENFNFVNDINNLTIEVQDRGCFKNGDPLPPYLVVTFEKLSFGLSFKCLEIEVVSRLNEPLLQYS